MKNSLILMFVLILFFAGYVKGENEPLPRTPMGYPKILKEDKWPSQSLYDTINACYQGTIRWVVLSQPSLGNQLPSIAAQRQMIEHCFCVVDKIRKENNFREYLKKVIDSKWTGNTFMVKAVECVGEYQTLPSFFTNLVIPSDNKTIEKEKDNKTIIPDVPLDPPEEPQGQKSIKSAEEPGLIFQG
jgi:hypothetical protein